MIKEHIMPDGQFMGSIVHRTQHLAGYRSFVHLPIDITPALTKEEITLDQTASQKLTNELEDWMQNHRLETLRYNLGISPPVKMVITARQEGKSWFQTAIEKYIFRRDRELSGTAQADQYPVYQTGTLGSGSSAQDAHPMRSAYEYSDPEREVPVVRVDVSPTFYMSEDVDRALANAIASVCSDYGDTHSLRDIVLRLREAQYRPVGTYKPDLDPQSHSIGGFGDPTDLFNRETIVLPVCVDGTEWALDMRFSTGVYTVGGYSWLGAYVHGVAIPIAPETRHPDPSWRRRVLMPSALLQGTYVLKHRGQVDPYSLYFDMFVPVEPEIVTTEWGWGKELEELLVSQSRNAAIDPTANSEPPSFVTNAWDRKAKHHKSATQIAQAEALKEHRDYELCLRIREATAQRERARKTLYKFAWKAVVLAVIECKQLTVEKL